ncbi:MAG: hypothetical protein ACTSUE_27130 [Promethearchaeota archaeon]
MVEYKSFIVDNFGNLGEVFTPDEFVEKMKENLSKNKFRADNSRLVFSVCPDDINRLRERRTVEQALKNVYGGEFHLGSLAAFPVAGLPGLVAASHHAPDNKEGGVMKSGNLLIFLSPHVGLIDEGGLTLGKITRPGQERVTSACGAMMGFFNELITFKESRDFQPACDGALDSMKKILYTNLLGGYATELDALLAEPDYNRRVIHLTRINLTSVLEKTRELVKVFLDTTAYSGRICLVHGITINTPGDDYFVMNGIDYFDGS